MNSIFTVISFTFRSKFRSKAFLVTSLILAIILSVVINLPYIISKFSSDEPTKIGMLQPLESVLSSQSVPGDIPSQLNNYFTKLKDSKISIVLLKDAGSAEANDKLVKDQIHSGELDGFLEMKAKGEGQFPDFVYMTKKSMDFGPMSTLENALKSIQTMEVVKDLKLTEEQLTRLNAPINVETVKITSGGESTDQKTPKQQVMNYGLVYAFLVLLFMTVTMYGNMIASEITAEKSSRVMELLISSVSPLKQMFGKILAMCLLGIVQIAVFIAIAIININLPHNADLLKQFGFSLSDLDPLMAVYFVVFYLLGFFLFATIFAAVGSLVSRTEDLGQAIMPLTFLMLAGFYIAIFGINAPNSTFITSMSFVPFFTPLIMFLRIGMTETPVWQVAVSLVELAASIFIFGWLGSKIYRTGVLMYGKRPSFKELRKAMKAYKV